MDDKTQKEKLEQEISFLKESFEAEVISKEEYEKGKERLEKKLKEIGKPADETQNEAVNESENAIAVTPQQEEQEEQEDKQEEHKPESAAEKPATKPTTEKEEAKKQAKFSKFFKYFAILIALVIILFLSYSLLKVVASKSNIKSNEAKEAKSAGVAIKANVLILNDRSNCFNCDTQRVLGILDGWFGAVNAEEIEHATQKGRELAEKFGIEALPAYILDGSIEKSKNYGQIKQAFIKKDNSYILSESASGSTLYLKRETIPNKLDLFVISGDSISAKAENNLNEFLDAFREVKFDKHTSEEELTKELRIKNFPAFLINNRVKFSGVNTAETIKDNFCKMNKLEGCEKSLSKSLV